MGINERKEKHREILRRRIINEAFKILSENGWEKLTIRNLADSIDYSPRTIYLYFKNKDALISAVIEEVFSETVSRLDTLAEKIDDSEQIILSMIDRHIRNGIQIPLLYRSIVNEVNGKSHITGTAEKALLDKLANLLSQFISKEQKLSPEQTAEFFINTLRSTTLMLINKLPELNREEIEAYIEFYKETFSRGLLWEKENN